MVKECWSTKLGKKLTLKRPSELYPGDVVMRQGQLMVVERYHSNAGVSKLRFTSGVIAEVGPNWMIPLVSRNQVR